MFTFTKTNMYLPEKTLKGGTGYSLSSSLPDGIEHIFPDYTLYPQKNFALGFLTRGCPNKCKWCIVPEKEGKIRAHTNFEEFARKDTPHIIFMDNNVLAGEHGKKEIERLAKSDYKVDFNQGLDARIIADDDAIAKRLAKLKWFKPLRLACDTLSQMSAVERAVKKLRNHGCKPKQYFCYVLVREDIEDALERILFLKKLKVDPFAQPYRDLEGKTEPVKEQKDFARWVNHKAVFNTVPWEAYKKSKEVIQATKEEQAEA